MGLTELTLSFTTVIAPRGLQHWMSHTSCIDKLFYKINFCSFPYTCDVHVLINYAFSHSIFFYKTD